MLFRLPHLLVLCHTFCLALSAELRIQIPASNLIANPNTLPASTHATIIGPSGEIRASLRKDNTILFSTVPVPGSHLLSIYTRDFVFATYRVDIIGDATSTRISAIFESYPGTRWTDHGIALISNDSPVSTYTLLPKVMENKKFYEERAGFSPLVLLKNPMILLGGGALLFTFGFPKLLENMDPEMKAEFEEMQKQGPTAGLSRAIQGQSSGGAGSFDLAGYLSGSTPSENVRTSGRENANNVRERRR